MKKNYIFKFRITRDVTILFTTFLFLNMFLLKTNSLCSQSLGLVTNIAATNIGTTVNSDFMKAPGDAKASILNNAANVKSLSINSAPVFSSSNYNYTVSEEIALGSSVGSIAATDLDGDVLTYSIKTGNTNNCFAINAATGSLTVNKRLNHHTQDIYTIKVGVTDNGGLSDEATVTITVQAGAAKPSFTTITWGNAASQPYGTHEVHGEVVNGKLYMFGGYDVQKRPAYTPTKRAFVYNPSTNTWSPLADLPYTPNGTNFGGVTHEGLATDGTDIYFAGGYTSNASGTGQVFGTKQVWKYNVASNTYSVLPGLPEELAAGQLRYLKGKLHYMGGANKLRLDVAVHYALDLDSLSKGWKALAPLINACNHPGSEVYEGKIYFIGGSHGQDDESVTQNTVQVYNPDTNTWSLAANLPAARDHISSAVTVMGNRILVLGGETSHNVKSNLVSAYTPANNTWTNLTPLPISKAAGVVAVLNGALYYIGGNYAVTNYKGVPVASAGQQVVSLTLINADTEQPIQTLKNGDTLNFSTLPTQNLNIRANTNPPVIGSVVFNLTGTQSKNVTESKVPYALFGDDTNGDYNSWTPVIGNYTLKATPYTSSGGSGVMGTAISVSFIVTNQTTLKPLADAYVRNGNYSGINYGNDPALAVKTSSPNSTGYTRTSYLKFSLNNISKMSSAKLRIYGNNTENTQAINISVYGVNNDTWAENTITWNNASAASTAVLSSIAVNGQLKYYELDVTSFVATQLAGDKVVSFLLKDPANANTILAFNSKENGQNLPQLLIENSGLTTSIVSMTLPFSPGSFTKIKVYPNPINKEFNVEFPRSYKGDFNLQIIDPVGRTYELGKSKLKPEAYNMKIDISKLSLKPGIYFLKVYSDAKQIETIKLIIE